ncbi:MAG: hypothetical protein IPM29_09980 [Planctomycetes bacterium]|nr:hypothetical protein [Planctomycetota bacterium]
MRTALLLATLIVAARPTAQIASGHLVVLAATPAGGSALFDVDPGSGAVRALPGFSVDALPPQACVFDPVGRHALVAVGTGAGSLLVRVDPAGSFERILATLPDPVLGLELDSDADLYVLTGGANGAFWVVPRNGGAAEHRMALPYATAVGMPQRFAIAWVAQASPGATAPAVTFVDPRLGTVLVPPIALPGLAGRRLTGIADLPTGAPREALVDDRGDVHLLEFGATLTTLAVTPPLSPGATAALRIDSGTSLDAIVLGDARQPFVHRVPVFGAPPVATRLAGPIPGAPVAFAVVDSAEGGSFGADCGGAFGAKSFVALPGTVGFLECRRAPPLAAAWAVFGVSEQRTAQGPWLPAALPGGCDLLVSPDVVVAIVTPATGIARVQFPVPAAVPRGLAVFAQWLFPGAGAIGSSVALAQQWEP